VVADGAALAAASEPDPHLRGRFIALASASIDRLEGTYGVGPYGFPLVPGAFDGAQLAGRGVDSYADTRIYNGLSVYALDQARSTLVGLADFATSIPATRPGIVRSPLQSGLVDITRGGLWAAIVTGNRAGDARYGGGVAALQQRSPDGSWQPVIPARPLVKSPLPLVSVLQGRVAYSPASTITRRVGSGVDAVGAWTRPGAHLGALDSGTVWRWQLVDDHTLELRWTAKSARTLAVRALVASGGAVVRTASGAVITRPDGPQVSYSLLAGARALRPTLTVQGVGASAYDPAVRAAVLRTPIRPGQRITLRVRVRAAP